MKNKQIIIFGTGTLAQLADYYFTNDSDYQVIGFTEDDLTSNEEDTYLDRPLYKWSEVVAKFEPAQIDIFIAIGYKKTNTIRRTRFDQAKAAGFNLASYISSRAINFATAIGDNCFILESNVLQPFSEIEDCVTMWSGNHLGHHSVLKQNCFITSHVVISGKCTIGQNSFIGVNASIHDNVKVGESCIIGAGAIVAQSCENRSVFSPAKTDAKVIKRDII
ncbi:acetyltransferase [Planktomarina temperata]|nr:acetyltransferase [Planktomarina temperata]